MRAPGPRSPQFRGGTPRAGSAFLRRAASAQALAAAVTLLRPLVFYRRGAPRPQLVLAGGMKGHLCNLGQTPCLNQLVFWPLLAITRAKTRDVSISKGEFGSSWILPV